MKLAWTKDAQRDLEEIRDYSIARWGRRIAGDYVGQIVACASASARDPARLRHYSDAYTYARSGSHYVFFRGEPGLNRLIVVRILHSSMDVGRHLPDADYA